ncbi:nebulette isoform X2 [Pleurodeles waltl]|uniref:nebulette isoform X2 n=1 Tax=Pleurodeles waltl TaxID=8319 RepID=UPI003709BFED
MYQHCECSTFDSPSSAKMWISYKEQYEKTKGKCLFVPDTLHVKNVSDAISETKYKEDKKKLSDSLYKQMPATIDTAFAKEVSQYQSEVLYKQKHDAEKGRSSYSCMQEPPDIKHAMEVSRHQSDASYKKDAQEMHRYTDVLGRADIKFATQSAKIISDVEYKKGRRDLNKETAVLGRPDFEHAMEASKLSSQVKYKEVFDKEIKGRKSQYNPMESAAFKQAQIASAMASDVTYRKDIQQMHEPTLDLPNMLYLEHALKASRMQSIHEYKKDFEATKGNFHFAIDTAEHIHHKENAVLQSQVKYKGDYEKSKGRSMLEFVDTPTYQVSKDAQKFQSEKLYRKDYEEGIKGRACADLDLTPTYLHVKHVTNLLKEKEYKKDLEEGMKGKGLTVLEDTPDLIRVKNASHILNEKEYRKDLENEIKGKGMDVSSEMPDIQRVKRVSELLSQKEYKKDLETEIKGRGMQVGTDIPDMQRAKRATEIASMNKYKDKAGKMLSSFSTVADTPEIQRVKNSQRNISAVLYKEGVGAGTAVSETPELERIKQTQQNISGVKYKKEIGTPTPISDPPEMKRVKENQKNISNIHYKEQPGKATSVSVTPEIERVKKNQQQLSLIQYKEQLGKVTSVSITPEMERVKANQENLSTIHYKEQPGKVTPVGVTPEMERVKKNQENISSIKYSSDLQQMKGRPSMLIDTPELRHVRETQNNISMVKYHEDFEKTKGRGFTPVVDDPVTERVRRNTQIVSDAAYKGVHPHVVEMDRKPGIIVDLKVWRTDPGSIFDIDPLEDNIQSRSLRSITEKANRFNKQQQNSSSVAELSMGDDTSEFSEMIPSCSYYSEGTKPSFEGAPVLPGAYTQSPPQGYGYMHQASMSSMRSMHSQPLSPSLRTYRAMYDYSAQDEDEVSFRDGDYIINVQAIDDGWMYGTVQRTGKTGMLPANYIELVN